MSVLGQLERAHDLSPAERELATYILEHGDDVVRMGIGELAGKTYKSNSTIIRLCRKVGTRGWRDFRVELAADLVRQRHEERGVDPNMPFQQRQSTAQVMSLIATLQREAIEDCQADVSVAQVDALAQAVHRAERIIIFARGDSYPVSIAFASFMSKIGKTCVDAWQYRLANESAFHATPRDLALFITYSGGSIEHYDTSVQTLRRRGCPMGIVTSYAPAADRFSGFGYPVIVPHRESNYGKIASFYSQACVRYVLGCVYSVVFSQDFDANLRDKELIDRIEPSMDR